MLKKSVFLYIVLFLLVFCMDFSLAFAEDELQVIAVEQRVDYMCGDTFEISFPDVLSSGSMFTNASMVQATAGRGETLLQVRVKLRNMTTSVFHGISKESFKLTGYVRDRSVTYTPEIILNTDYFGSGVYYAWDQLPPLRVADILLIFRVNPILINWELSFVPVFSSEAEYIFDRVTYESRRVAPCSGLFQFPSVSNLETGALTRFTR